MICKYILLITFSNEPKLIFCELGVVAVKKGAFESPLTTVANFTYFIWFQVFLSNTNNSIDY